MLIFASADLGQAVGNRPHLITEDPQNVRLLGKLWGAAKVAGGEAALAGRAGPSPFGETERDDSQLASAVTAESGSAPALGNRFWQRASELGLNERDCDCPGLRRISKRFRNAP